MFICQLIFNFVKLYYFYNLVIFYEIYHSIKPFILKKILLNSIEKVQKTTSPGSAWIYFCKFLSNSWFDQLKHSLSLKIVLLKKYISFGLYLFHCHNLKYGGQFWKFLILIQAFLAWHDMNWPILTKLHLTWTDLP